MGLAASQARFLAITSRKARCEFESMSIAQDKLSVTRDLEKISKDYQQALNQTSLAWDFDGSGVDLLDLTYGLLMTPTAVNNFNPCLITDRASRVVLNGPMAAAAQKACPNGQPCERSKDGFHEFMWELYQQGVITSAEEKKIYNLAYTNDKYDPLAGYGAEPLNKNGAIAANIYGLAHKVEEKLIAAQTDQIKKSSINIYDKIVGGSAEVYVDGAKTTTLTVEDLFTKNVVVMDLFGDGSHDWADTNDCDNGITWINNLINGALKDILDTDAITTARYQEALNATKNQFKDSNRHTYSSGEKTGEDSVKNQLLGLANEQNRQVFFENKGNNYNSGVAVNLSSMLSYFLTMFETKMNGYNNGYYAGAEMSYSSMVTDNPDYSYVMKDPGAVDNEVLLKADFYMQIYNNICINGWTKNPDIDSDPEYLEQMLKSGHYFITSLNLDGYFYQNRYNELETILEIKDTDAIARAEAEYTSKKAKLTYKENQLDLDMKNLDAEISALTTEYDTVKNLISKNVEKVFQMFQ